MKAMAPVRCGMMIWCADTGAMIRTTAPDRAAACNLVPYCCELVGLFCNSSFFDAFFFLDTYFWRLRPKCAQLSPDCDCLERTVGNCGHVHWAREFKRPKVTELDTNV